MATIFMAILNFFKAITIIFILSVAGTSMWLYEILKIKGWHGLNWLNEQLYSPYIVTLIAAFAFITPFIIRKQTTTKKILLSSIVLYAVNILCFEAGKLLCYALYCRFCFWTTKDIVLIFSITFILLIFLNIVYWFVTNKLIKKNKKINMLFITFFTLLIIPLSLLTIQINSGFGAGADWIDAVKMGYPIFWTIMALGLSGIIIAKQKNDNIALHTGNF